MVDPKDKQLRPPIRRSWLRLRLGKAWYSGRRHLLWLSPRFRWATRRQAERLSCVQFSHATPLYRHLRGEDQILQENKVANLRLAAARLDGRSLVPLLRGGTGKSGVSPLDNPLKLCYSSLTVKKRSCSRASPCPESPRPVRGGEGAL